MTGCRSLPEKLRLAGHGHWETTDPDEATVRFSLVHRRFRHTIKGREYRHISNTAALDRLSVTSVFEAAERETRLDPDLQNYLAVFWNVGISGVDTYARRWIPGPGEGLVLTPDEESRIVSSPNQDLTVVSIPSEVLRGQAEDVLGRPLVKPPEIRGIFSRSSHLWKMARHLLDQVEGGISQTAPIVARDLQNHLIRLVIEEGLLTNHARSRAPLHLAAQHVRRAKEYADAHPYHTPTDMAHFAGVSLRTLELAFQAVDNTSPRKFLLAMRLEWMHQELKRRPYDRIASIAKECGLSPKHIAQHYEARFGIRPLATQLQARKHQS